MKIADVLRSIAVLLNLAFLGACGGGGGGSTPTAPAPSIQAFTVDLSSVGSGQTVKLTATFTNGVGTIDKGVGSVSSGQAVTTTALTAPTTFTLTVAGSGGTATATVTVAVTRFSAVGSLAVGRYGHTATLLASGKVLIVGGYAANGPIASAELYDPIAKTFSPTGSMQVARARHTATLLRNGKVFIYGLMNELDINVAGEIFDPATGQFTSILPIDYAEHAHTATLLANGKVIIAGGGKNPTKDVTVFDSATGLFTGGGTLLSPRAGHTAMLLPDGGVLVVGGISAAVYAERYDPTTGTSAVIDPRPVTRTEHAAIVLASGKLLVAGGWPGPLASAELFNPLTNAFSPTGSLSAAAGDFNLVALPSGLVLAAGMAPANLYDPATGTFASLGEGTARPFSTATALQDGSILIVGGGSSLATAEIFK
jgi:hypothetical protein